MHLPARSCCAKISAAHLPALQNGLCRKRRRKAYLNIKSSDGLTLYKGSGCEKCRGTGYLGRMALQEVMPVVPELKKFILGKAQEETLFAEAEKFGAVSMHSDGVQKVLKGHTSLAEVLQAVH